MSRMSAPARKALGARASRNPRRSHAAAMLGIRALLLASVGLLVLVISAASAQAAETVTRTFTGEGTEQTFLVPAGVASIEVDAVGGAGGGTLLSEGGSGARIEGTLAVTPGSTLYVEVGNEGFFAGSGSAAVGGTPSDVRTKPRAFHVNPEDRLIVAGAGGGAGEEPAPGGEGEPVGGGEGGAAGGASGEEGGEGIFAPGGRGGTQKAGGFGGGEFGGRRCSVEAHAEAGERELGGEGGFCSPTHIEGGGGGGGYFGGGGGAADFSGGGGGGGSSLVPAGGSVTVGEYAAPEVRVSYVQPPNAPVVTTLPASEVRRETATVNATVNPEDEEVTSCELEYGATKAYGSEAPCSPSPGAGITAVAVSANLSGLEVGAGYHYRVVATNANGTSFGADETFTTLTREPPLVSGVSPEKGRSAGGETVTISGQEFTGATSVSFGSIPAKSFTVDSNETITAVTPASGGTVSVLVTTASGTSPGTVHFSFLLPPTVTKITPRLGPAAGGTMVAIEGSGFTAASTVSFGSNTAASVTFNSPTSLTADSPAGVATVDVTVTTPIAGSSAPVAEDRFAYEAGAPEYGRCISPAFNTKVGHVEFSDSKCTVSSPTDSGKYRWEPGVADAWTGESSRAAPKLETTSKVAVGCQRAFIAGHITSSTSVSETIRFIDCAIDLGPACTSPGLASGEVVTSALVGTLAWESKAKKKAALVLSSASGPFMQYTCAGATTTVTGSLLAPFKAAKMEAHTKLKLAGSKGKQKAELLEDGERHALSSSLEGGPAEGLSLSFQGQQNYERTLEINPAI
jgi:IPT/TIG domain/Glycine rich protein